MTKLFNSYRNTERLQDTEQLVWFTEKDHHRKKGDLTVGHTKCYTKVTVPLDSSLLGTCVRMKISDCQKWHVEGEILERNVRQKIPDRSYFDPARERLSKKKKAPKKKKKLSGEKAAKLRELVDLEAESDSEASPENSLKSENDTAAIDSDLEKTEKSLSGKEAPVELQNYIKMMDFIDKRNWFEKLAFALLFVGIILKIFGL